MHVPNIRYGGDSIRTVELEWSDRRGNVRTWVRSVLYRDLGGVARDVAGWKTFGTTATKQRANEGQAVQKLECLRGKWDGVGCGTCRSLSYVKMVEARVSRWRERIMPLSNSWPHECSVEGDSRWAAC